MNSRGVVLTLALLLLFSAGPLLAEETELSPVEGSDRYEHLVQLHPQKASYRNALGYYYLKAENYQKAEDCFLEALELDRSYATAHNNLGIVYLRQQRPEQAEDEFRQALELNPRYCKAQYNLAVALFRQRLYGQAAKAYLKAREMDSDYVDRRGSHEKVQEKMKEALKQVGKDDESARELKRLKQWFAPYY